MAYCADSSRITAAGTVADLHSVPSLTKPLLAPKPDTKIEDNLIAWLAFNIKFRETFLSR